MNDVKQVMKFKSVQVVVLAVAMTRLEYNNLRGWDLPEDEDGDDKGFLVENPLLKPNSEDFDGYVCWKPEEVFDKEFEADEPVHFMQRVMDEMTELTGNCNKLSEFLGSKVYNSLDDGEKSRLYHQLNAMQLYAFILNERIAAHIKTTGAVKVDAETPEEGAE